jgi:hypothetical protein
MLRQRYVRSFVVLGLGLGMWVGDAEAGRSRCAVDVDIESLKARVYRSVDGWRVRVAYEVEVEPAERDRFDLVLRFTERGRPVVDRRNRPVDYVIALDTPTEVDDDELEFEGRFEDRVCGFSACNCKRIRLEAQVIDRLSGKVVEAKRVRVKRK